MSLTGNRTVLIVEDNEPSRDALSRRLERRGFHVVAAMDGEVAVEMATEILPDIILMDLGLPGIDGWEATARLKRGDVTGQIPIIVLSAHAMPSDRETALVAGADDFDTKPVQFQRLLDKMDALLAKGVTR
jgi:CheY-like chemotaxis protein